MREAPEKEKSTLRNFMAIIAMNSYSWNMVSLSLDSAEKNKTG